MHRTSLHFCTLSFKEDPKRWGPVLRNSLILMSLKANFITLNSQKMAHVMVGSLVLSIVE